MGAGDRPVDLVDRRLQATLDLIDAGSHPAVRGVGAGEGAVGLVDRGLQAALECIHPARHVRVVVAAALVSVRRRLRVGERALEGPRQFALQSIEVRGPGLSCHRLVSPCEGWKGGRGGAPGDRP